MSKGFDKRIVSYERLHSIKPEDFQILIDAISPKIGEVILDAMCGYGAVGKAVLEKEPKSEVYFLDESSVQLERAIANVQNVDNDHFILDSLPHDNFQDDFFDTVVIKMGLHEVSLTKHLEILKELKRILKPDGKVVVWDIMLNDSTQELFQAIIRKKDELAGFDLLMEERYFFREDEFIKNAKWAGFENRKDYHTISYRFSSLQRLEQELGADREKLKQLNEFIRDRFNEDLKEKLNYEDLGDDIRFTVTKKIYILKE